MQPLVPRTDNKLAISIRIQLCVEGERKVKRDKRLGGDIQSSAIGFLVGELPCRSIVERGHSKQSASKPHSKISRR